jgi:hypothetical protein
MAGIHQPNDARGFEIAYLRSGDTSLEVFTFAKSSLQHRAPQFDAPGFLAVELDGADIEPAVVGRIEGHRAVAADADGLQRLVRE